MTQGARNVMRAKRFFWKKPTADIKRKMPITTLSGPAPEVHHSDQETCFSLMLKLAEGINEDSGNKMPPKKLQGKKTNLRKMGISMNRK
jgi:hypothetical protein